MKRLFHILLIASFIFLFIYLIRMDRIEPEIVRPLYLYLSLVLLFSGFLASSFSWWVALRSHSLRVSFREALISHGLSVFAKYIPGKIWVILGRAASLSANKSEMKNRSFISLIEQVVYLWAGFLISSIPTIVFYGHHWISYLTGALVAGLTLFLYSERVHHTSVNLLQRLIRKKMDLPLLKIRQVWPMAGAVLLIWVLWTAGFFLFMHAFSLEITPVMMFAFPLSVCFGLIAVILPAGLGLREGIIIGYLTLAGLGAESATTISFFNRIWFIAGEGFIFLLALVLWIISATGRYPGYPSTWRKTRTEGRK